MEIRWRNITGQPNYMISTDGVVLNKTTGLLSIGNIVNGYYCFRFPNGKRVLIARLVLNAFTRKPPIYKVVRTSSSLDVNLSSVSRGTMGEALRAAANRKNTLRGVHAWNRGKKSWRATINPGAGKSVTLGYFNKKEDAIRTYHDKYTELFGCAPFDLMQMLDNHKEV